MDLVILKVKPRADDSRFGPLENYEPKYKLHHGVSLAAEFPADAVFKMQDDFPTNGSVGDFAGVIGNLLVVSKKARDFLEGKAPLEFLPVSLLNLQGTKLKEPYWVANILRVVDCVDRERTKYRKSPIKPKRMVGISNLTLEASKLPTDTELFQLEDVAAGIVASRSLANALLKAKLTGIVAGELADFRS